MRVYFVAVIFLFCSLSHGANLKGVPVLNEVSHASPTSCLDWVYTDGIEGEKPSCASPSYNRLVFDFCTEQGKAWLSIILAYNAQQKPMKIVGSGSCSLHSNTESVQYLRLNEGE